MSTVKCAERATHPVSSGVSIILTMDVWIAMVNELKKKSKSERVIEGDNSCCKQKRKKKARALWKNG